MSPWLMNWTESPTRCSLCCGGHVEIGTLTNTADGGGLIIRSFRSFTRQDVWWISISTHSQRINNIVSYHFTQKEYQQHLGISPTSTSKRRGKGNFLIPLLTSCRSMCCIIMLPILIFANNFLPHSISLCVQKFSNYSTPIGATFLCPRNPRS